MDFQTLPQTWPPTRRRVVNRRRQQGWRRGMTSSIVKNFRQISPVFSVFDKAFLMTMIPFPCSRWGQGGRAADRRQTNLCWEQRDPEGVAEREGGRGVDSSSNASQASSTCGLISRKTFHTTARHRACNRLSPTCSQPLPVLARMDIRPPPGGFALWLPGAFSRQSPSKDHIPAPTLTARRSLLSKEKLAGSQLLPGGSPRGLQQVCAAQEPLPLGSDQTHWPAGEGVNKIHRPGGLTPLSEPDSN